MLDWPPAKDYSYSYTAKDYSYSYTLRTNVAEFSRVVRDGDEFITIPMTKHGEQDLQIQLRAQRLAADKKVILGPLPSPDVTK